jgi:hypothetical protein
MCVGVTIASYGEIEFDLTGLVLQFLSIAAEAARLVVTQRLLQERLPKGSSPLVSISLFAPWSFLFLLPVALTQEPEAQVALQNVGLLVAGNTLTAFTLNIAVVILVAQTSGLTLTLAGIIKDILLIAASVWLFTSPITYTQVRFDLTRRARGGASPILTPSSTPPPPPPPPAPHTHARAHRWPATRLPCLASTCTTRTGRCGGRTWPSTPWRGMRRRTTA